MPKTKDKRGFPVMLSVCFWCGETKNEIVFGQRMVNDVDEVPREAVANYDPCETCEEHAKKGIAIYEAAESPLVEGQPEIQKGLYPTGRWMVVAPESIDRLVNDEQMAEEIKRQGKTFVEPAAFELLLPEKPGI